MPVSVIFSMKMTASATSSGWISVEGSRSGRAIRKLFRCPMLMEGPLLTARWVGPPLLIWEAPGIEEEYC